MSLKLRRRLTNPGFFFRRYSTPPSWYANPPLNTEVVNTSHTTGTFTMKDTSSGSNNTLCYKHRNEPWKLYHSFKHDVRMIHSITATAGDTNHSVADQIKELTFQGDGVQAGFFDGARTHLNDRVKWVKRIDLNDPSDVNYKRGQIGSVDGTLVNEDVSYDACNSMDATAAQNNATKVSASEARAERS